MNNVFNREREAWVRPWNQEKFDDLYNRDERFFAIVIKGLLSWLNRNIVLYNKSINHFIFNTGSSYLYMESNGYEYNVSETTGEDTIYMTLPRCLVEISDINIPMEELSAPFSRGNYERRNGNQLCGYNAEMRRLPVEITINMKYFLSNFNETIILLQELMDKLVFQRYFNITYLGKTVQCSIEFPANYNPEINKIDMTSPEPNQRNLTLDVKVCTNYPLIDVRTEIPTDKVISEFGHEVDLYLKGQKGDTLKKGNIISEDDGFTEFENNLVQGKEDIIFNDNNKPNIIRGLNRRLPYLIKGNENDETGNWTGELQDIDNYTNDLIIIYIPNSDGNENKTTLNINNLGERDIHDEDDTILTTQYNKYSILLMIYVGTVESGYWKIINKENLIPYFIEGNNNEDDILGQWTGEHSSIDNYKDNDVIIYIPNINGNEDKTTLNINNLGERDIYDTDDTIITNQYNKDNMLLMIYIGNTETGHWRVIDNTIIITSGIKDPWIKRFDINKDGIIDINDLIQRFDINGDNIIDEVELINILDKMKYGFYDPQYDYAEECHYKIDYKDVYYLIQLINKQDNISAHYDRFTKKIYVTHHDTGETAEIEMIKYKVIN